MTEKMSMEEFERRYLALLERVQAIRLKRKNQIRRMNTTARRKGLER